MSIGKVAQAAPAPAPRRRRWLRWVGGGAASLALLVALAPYLIPTGWVRGKICEAIGEATGAKAEIDSLSLGWTSVSVGGIRLGNPDDSPRAIEVGSVHVGFSAVSLLAGNIVLDPVRIEGVTARLVRRADGTLAIPMPLPPPTGEETASAEPISLPSLRAGVEIVGCAVRIDAEGDPAAGAEISPIHGSISVTALDAPITFEIRAGPAGHDVHVTGSATVGRDGLLVPEQAKVDATIEVTDLDGTPWMNLFVPGLPAGTAAAGLGATVNAAVDGQAARVDASFEAAGVRWSGAPVPTARVTAAAEVDLARMAVRVTSYGMEAPGIRATGTASATLPSPTRPAIDAEGTLDLAVDAAAACAWAGAFLPDLQAEGTAEVHATGGLAGDAFRGQVRLSGAGVKFRAQGMAGGLDRFGGEFAADGDLAAQRMRLAPSTFEMPGLSASFEGDWTGFDANGRGTVSARGTLADLGALRDAAAGFVEIPTRVAGSGSFEFAATVGDRQAADVTATASLEGVRVTDEAGETLFAAEDPLRLDLDAHADPIIGSIEIRKALADYGAGRVTAQGTLTRTPEGSEGPAQAEGALTVNGEADLARTLSLVRGFLPVPAGFAMEGTSTLRVTIGGDFDHPQVSAAVDLDERTPAGRRQTRLEAQATLDLPAERAVVELVRVLSGDDLVSMNAEFVGFGPRARGGGMAVIHLQDVAAWTARIEPLLPPDLPRVAGRLSLDLGFQGDGEGWRANLQRFETDLSVTDPALFPGGPYRTGPVTATAQASIPLGEDGLPLALREIDLSASFAGLATTVRGAIEDPLGASPRGEVSASLRGPLEGLHPLLASLGITDLSLANGGPLAADVTARLADGIDAHVTCEWERPAAALGAGAERLEFSRESLSVAADIRAPLSFERAAASDLTLVTGSVRVTGGIDVSSLAPEPVLASASLQGEADLADLATIPLVRDSLPEGTAMTGPVSFAVEASGPLTDLRARATFDGTGASVMLPETFEKPAGTPLTASVEAVYAGTEARVPSLQALLGEISCRGSATVSLGDVVVPRAAQLHVPEVALHTLATFLPPLREMGAQGGVAVEATLDGAGAHPTAQAVLAFREVSMRVGVDPATGAAGNLLTVNGPIAYRLAQDQDLLTSETLEATIDGQPAQVRIRLEGLGRTAGEVLGRPIPPDADPIATLVVPLLRGASGEVNVTIPEYTLTGNRISDLRLPVTLGGGRIEIREAGGGINRGTVRLDVTGDLTPAEPAWQVSLDLRDVNLRVENAPVLGMMCPLLAKVEGVASNSEFVMSLPVTILAEGATQARIVETLRTREDSTFRLAEGTIDGSRILQLAGSLMRKEGIVPYRFDGMEETFRVGGQRFEAIRSRFIGRENAITLTGWTSLAPRGDGQHEMLYRIGFEGTLGHSDDAAMQRVYDAIAAEGGLEMKGTVEAPEFGFDFGDALRRAAQDILRDEAGDRLRDEARDRLRDLFRNR